MQQALAAQALDGHNRCLQRVVCRAPVEMLGPYAENDFGAW
jgi:hypothetical protein